MFNKLVPYETAFMILEAYIHYYHQFKRVTKRAKIRFENRDWLGLQEDMGERSVLYRRIVNETTNEVRSFLSKTTANEENPQFWIEVKQNYFDEIRNFNTRNIAETFYNSVFRHSNQGLSANAETMFVHSTGTYREFKSVYPIYHTFDFPDNVETTVRRIISLYAFDAPYEDLERDIRFITNTRRFIAEKFRCNAAPTGRFL